jgi:predicted metal-dependent phosphoesterase TrpH
MRTDLHIHSLHSNDADFGIPEIIEKCHDCGIDTFSITDHNSIAGSIEAESLTAALEGMHFIPGIEIDCNYRGTDLHLLGYHVDLRSDDFHSLERRVNQQHMDAVPQMVRNLEKLGIPVDQDEVMNAAGGVPPSGELIAEVLLRNPVQQSNPLLKPYLTGGERSDMPLINFYLDFFAQGKPAYVRIEHIPFSEAVDLVRDNGGIPIVAHPGLNFAGREHEVGELLDRGAAGLEVFNNYHDPGQAEYFAELSRKRAVKMTCGSDFHGKNKPLISIGQYIRPGIYRDYLERSLSGILEYGINQ